MSAEMQKEDLSQESVFWMILPQWANLWGWEKTKYIQTSTSKTYTQQDTSSDYANREFWGIEGGKRGRDVVKKFCEQ